MPSSGTTTGDHFRTWGRTGVLTPLAPMVIIGTRLGLTGEGTIPIRHVPTGTVGTAAAASSGTFLTRLRLSAG